MCGKSGVQQGISNAAAFPGDSALAIRTPGDKENETVATRPASSATDEDRDAGSTICSIRYRQKGSQ